MTEYLKSVGRFLWYAARPAASGGAKANGVLGFFGLALGPVVGALADDAVVAGFVAMSVVVLYLAYGGIRLQREKEARERVRFYLDNAHVEVLDDNCQRNDIGFYMRSVLWVEVRNLGRESSFSASFDLDISTANRWMEGPLSHPYRENVAWEHHATRKTDIGFGDRARLMVAWAFVRPKVLWFVVPQSATWGRGDEGHTFGWIFEPKDAVIEFDLAVVNETDATSCLRRGCVTFANDGYVESFAVR